MSHIIETICIWKITLLYAFYPQLQLIIYQEKYKVNSIFFTSLTILSQNQQDKVTEIVDLFFQNCNIQLVTIKIELNSVLRQSYILKSSKCSNYDENNQLLSQQIKEIEDQLNSTAKLIESKLYEVQRLDVANSKQQTRLIAQLQHLQTECNILSSYKNIIGEILRRSPENILQVQSCTESQQEQHHNSIYNQSDYQPRDPNSIPVKQHKIDSTFQKKCLLAFKQILKEEGFSFDAKTDDEINQFVREMPKTSGFWVRVGQICEIGSKMLREYFNSQYKLIQTNGQNSILSNENEQTENSDQVILETHHEKQNKNESYYHLNELEIQASLNYKPQVNRTNKNEQQQIISEQDLIEQLTQAFQLILKEAGFTINGDDQLGIWKAVKSLSAQQRNQLKLWDRVVQICKLRDNKVAQQFFKQQCRKLQALQNETNDHSLFQDDRSQQELDKQNSEDIDVAQDLAQLNQDYVCYQDKPNEIESNQCQEEIQSIARESQVQLPDTQIILAQPESTENLIQAELQEQEVKAQESQPVLENELEPEIYIQTGILEQQARDLKYQIQVVSAQFQDEQHKLKLAHEIVKQLTAQSNNIISQSTPKEIIENIGVQMKNNDFLPLIFEQPEQQHSDRKELLEQEIQHLQKQLELASKKIRNEQYKLKLVNEVITNLICQNQQKTSEQNTLETHVLRTQQESYQKGIQESCSQSQQILANDSHLSIQNQKPNIEISYNQLEFVQLDQQDSCMHNNNQAHTISSQSDQLTSNNVQQSGFSLIQLDHQDDILNKSGQQVSAKQQGKQYSSQQLLLRLAVKQTLKEAGYEVETLSEKEICKTVHKLTAKEKRQLRFWDRVAQLCCRSKQQIVHFYRQTYKSSVYKNKPNQRVRVDNQEQLVCQQSDIQNNQKVNTTQKDGQVIIRKKRVRASQIGPQLMSFALRQVLTEIGYPVETASEREICNHVDQISINLKMQYKFWDRISVLCQQSKGKVKSFYYRIFRTNMFTETLDNNDKAVIDEYISRNQIMNILETTTTIANTYFKDRSISMFEIKQHILKQSRNEDFTQKINRSKLLSCALKQILRDHGHQVQNASDKELCFYVDQIHQAQKRNLKFWDRVSVLCQLSKQQVKTYYYQTYKTTDKWNNYNNYNNETTINIQLIQSTLLTNSIKQILKEVGYQVQNASDKELCYHVDQMSQGQKVQFKFWERVSILCQKSKDQVWRQYSRFKQHIFTDKLNDEDNTALNEYMQLNGDISWEQTIDTVLKTVLKDKNISFSEVQKYIQQQKQKQYESGFINPQTTQNTQGNQTPQLQFQNQTYNQLNDQYPNNVNITRHDVGQIATKSTVNHEYRFKLLSLALKQVLKEDGYLVETVSENELCHIVDQMPQNDKILLNFWGRVSVLCQQPKVAVKRFYSSSYKCTNHQQNDKVGTDEQTKQIACNHYNTQKSSDEGGITQKELTMMKQVAVEQNNRAIDISQDNVYYQQVYKQCIFTNLRHKDVKPILTQQLETNNGNQQNENIEQNEVVIEQQSAQNLQTQIQHCEAQRIDSTSDCQNTKFNEQPTSAYSHQILLEQQSDAKTKLDCSEALNQIQPEIGSQQATETQKELAIMEQAFMEQLNHVIDISYDNVNSSMIKRLPKQIVESNTDKRETQHQTEQNQEQNKPLTQNNVQPQKLTPYIQSKLRQQIPLALKKVFGDSGYNVKNATEKELCALVLFMTNRQKTEIDLWNKAAQICEINKTQLYKFYQYKYSTVLYSRGKDDNVVINNQKDTTDINWKDTMSSKQQLSKDNKINNYQTKNLKQDLCQKNSHMMSKSLQTLDLEAMRESVNALVPKFVPAIPQSIIYDKSQQQNTQNDVQQVQSLTIQSSLNINIMCSAADIMIPKFIPIVQIQDKPQIQNKQNNQNLINSLNMQVINKTVDIKVPMFIPALPKIVPNRDKEDKSLSKYQKLPIQTNVK
ncbi:Hypothetical_protein [Hexamita inflata]|uniref:Hypothetical_protein n=1 Tax=Hexamita inflata TaxID=28002 RepID=A0AA86R4E9_9EUKA|nr:Hypothetical protein HINF_LOCUS53512 [Hexamita inflata]